MEQVVNLKNLGNDAFKNQNYDLAIDYFTKAIELQPNDPILYSNRSGAYAAIRDGDNALNDANKVLELNVNFIKGYSRKAAALSLLHRYEEAKITYNQGLELDPENKGLLDGLNWLKNNENNKENSNDFNNFFNEFKNNKNPDFNELLKNFQEFQKKNPDFMKNYDLNNNNPNIDNNNFNFNNNSNNDMNNNINKQNREEKKEPEVINEISEAESYKIKGNNAYKNKNFEEAEEYYNKAIELDPNELLYIYNKSAIYIEKNNLVEAEKLMLSAIDKINEGLNVPILTRSKIYARLGTIYEKCKRYDDAIKSYKNSLVEHKDKNIKIRLNECEKLKIEADKRSYIDIDKSNQLREEGNELFKKGKYPEAKKIYDESIKRNPEDARIYANRAAVYMKLLEYPCALIDVEKSISLDPKVPKVYARKGNIHMMLKDYHKAISAFDEGLKIDPQSPECLKGKYEVQVKITESQKNNNVDEDQVRRAMSDPEIQSLLSDPKIRSALDEIQNNPSSAMQYLKDPYISNAFQKLIAAGIIKTQ